MTYRVPQSAIYALVLSLIVLVACSDDGENSATSPNNNGSTSTNAGTANNTATTGTNNGGTNNGGTNNATSTAGLSVADAQARSCEVMLNDPGKRIAQIAFAEGVEGRSMRRGDNIAVVFFTKSDSAMPGGAVTLDVQDASGDVLIAQERCFDALGALIAQPGIALKL